MTDPDWARGFSEAIPVLRHPMWPLLRPRMITLLQFSSAAYASGFLEAVATIERNRACTCSDCPIHGSPGDRIIAPHEN